MIDIIVGIIVFIIMTEGMFWNCPREYNKSRGTMLISKIISMVVGTIFGCMLYVTSHIIESDISGAIAFIEKSGPIILGIILLIVFIVVNIELKYRIKKNGFTKNIGKRR